MTDKITPISNTDGQKIITANANNAVVVEIENLFDDAKHEIFADGMDSTYTNKLRKIITRYGNTSIRSLEQSLLSDNSNIEIIEESLRLVGNIDDYVTYDRRLEFLKHMLKSSNVRIRDAALIGLEAMDDPSAIDNIEKAIDCEKSQIMKVNLEMTLKQLKETADSVVK